MDTGTTLCLVDDAFAKAVYAAIPGGKYDSTQQGYVFPTSTAASDLPVVTLAVGDHQYTINKEDLGFADAGNGMTYGGIQSRGNMTFDIYGDTVLVNRSLAVADLKSNANMPLFRLEIDLRHFRPRKPKIRSCSAPRLLNSQLLSTLTVCHQWHRCLPISRIL